MQVLALGFSRTGTASLKIALETLGYVPTSHGYVVVSSSSEVLDMWIAAIRAKFYGEGTPYGKAEWDRLLGSYQAVSDVPHVLFAEELIATYPDAKVILTNRDVDSWWKSYEATVADVRRASFLLRLSNWVDPGYNGKREYLLRLVSEAFFKEEYPENVTEDIAKARFVAHYDEVRRLTSKDRLLEFEVKEGWAPLAAFLGKEAPAMAFPRVNDTAQFHKVVAVRRRAVLWVCAPYTVATLLAGLAAIILCSRGTQRT